MLGHNIYEGYYYLKCFLLDRVVTELCLYISSSLWPRAFFNLFGRGFSVPQCFWATFCYIWFKSQIQHFPKKLTPPILLNYSFFPERASFIISLIGISNTLGRLITGAFVDLPWVSSLVVTNCSLVSWCLSEALANLSLVIVVANIFCKLDILMTGWSFEYF